MHWEPGVVVLIGTLPGSSYGGHLGHTTSQLELRNFSQLWWRQQPRVHYGKDNTSSVVVTTWTEPPPIRGVYASNPPKAKRVRMATQ